jgi:hypothetical protein
MARTAPAWRYDFLPDPVADSFDLRFRLRAVSGAEAGRFRMLFGDPAAGAFILEVGPEGTRSGRLMGGREQGLMVQGADTLSDLNGSELVYEQRPHRWALCAEGRLIASGGAPPPSGVRIAFGAAGADIELPDLRVQPVTDIRFADSFMRTPEDPSLWTETRGAWRLNVQRNPLLSANAFQYVAVGTAPTNEDAELVEMYPAAEVTPVPKADVSAEATPVANADLSAEASSVANAESITGDWFWSDLHYEAAVRPGPRGAAGLVLCRRGPDDYILFRWTANDSPRPCRQVIRCVKGEETVLAESPGGYAPNRWYQLSAFIGTGWSEMLIDDTTVFRVRDPYLTYGRIGLVAEGPENTLFDDVRVENRRAVLADFGRLCGGEGLISGGEWLPVAAIAEDYEAWPGGVVARAAAPARLVWGDPLWRDYTLSARLDPLSGGTAGLCFRYQDEKNYGLARLHAGPSQRVDLVKVREGRPEILAEAPLSVDKNADPANRPIRIEVVADGSEISFLVDGRETLRAMDEELARGRVGLCVQSLDHGVFSDVICRFPEGERPATSDRQAFEAEETMQIWSGAMSDWNFADAAGDSVPVGEDASPDETEGFWWHRSDFFGDVRMEMRLAEAPPPGGEVGLLLCAEDQTAESGFKAGLLRDAIDESDRTFILTLISPGGEPRTAPLDWVDGPLTLVLARLGNGITLFANDRPILSARDDRESPGRRLGWFARDATITLDDVALYSNTIMDYAFNSAPTDWREASGAWEVTNKWTCDPRWSFFSGRARAKDAVLWNKRPLRGDFTIEFYVGNKMDPTRDEKGRYSYARDMDITVCADGNDLDTGYSFLFGGFGNTITCVYRGSERWTIPLEGRSGVIETAGLHRRWYHIAVSRRGNTFEMRVDDEPVLRREDPDPLPGGHWAIWTRDNGIMVARVRVCAEEIGPRDSPDLPRPAPARSIYDD